MRRFKQHQALVISALCTMNFAPISFAQPASTSDQGQAEQPRKFTGKLLEFRIRKQRSHIQQALTDGTLNKAQADAINGKLDAIAADIDKSRNRNGGILQPNEMMSLDNRLSETRGILQARAGADKHIDDGPNTLGAKWAPGKDGGQNPNKLTKEMRSEERRELRQERQNSQEALERRQLEYEQEATAALNKNRSTIMQEKNGLENQRTQGGN